VTPPPDAALLELLALDTALPRVVAFARRFGGQHAELAMHAALPIGLTPELVHLLRINFVPRVPFIAEADLLLSPLCREVGGGMYEMDEEVRELLLSELTQTFGRARAREVADFLVLYATRALHQTTDADQRAHLRAQQWVALAHSHPTLAAEELADALRTGVEAGDTPEVGRLARLTATLTVPLAGQPGLLVYAAGLERLTEGRSDAANQLFASVGDPEREVMVGRVTLPAPRAAAERMGLAAPSTPSSAPWVERSYLRPELELRRGDRGAEVQELQRDLHSLGYFRGPADGVFGPQTQEAVGMLQRDLLEDEAVRSHNRGRITSVSGTADPGFLECVAEMVAARAAAERPDEREPERPAEEGAPAGYRVAKVVVVGDIGAGKRSIIEPFERGGGRAILTPTRTRPLWQVPPSKERPRLDGELVFWDASGHPHWPVELDLQDAAAVVITVESHGSSREVVDRWLRTVRSAFPPGAMPPVILVGSTARENYRPGSQSKEPLRFRDAAQTERELRELAAEQALHGAMVIDADGQANLEVLPAQVLDAIDWARVPAVESREAYNAIERALPGTDSRSQLAIRMRELLQRIRHRYPQLETAERAAYAGLAVAEARDQVRVLRGFEPVLVDPDLYAALVQAMFEAIGNGEGGLPAVPEPMLRRGEFRHPVERALGDLDPDTRSGLFDGLVDTLLASGLAVRADLAKGGFVVVPSLFQAAEEDDWDDRSNELLLGVRWAGHAETAYVLLLVHLAHSGRFRDIRIGRHLSSFRLGEGQRVGIYAGSGAEGEAALNVLAEEPLARSYRVGAASLNLRQDPSTSAPRLAVLTQGTQVRKLAEAKAEGWWLVETTAGEKGYVHHRFVEPGSSEADAFVDFVRDLIPRCVPEGTTLRFVEPDGQPEQETGTARQAAAEPGEVLLYLSVAETDRTQDLLEFLDSLATEVASRLGRPVRLAGPVAYELPAEIDWQRHASEELFRSHFFLAILTEDYLASPWCGREFAAFRSRLIGEVDDAESASLILPVRWRDPLPPELPPVLRELQIYDPRDHGSGPGTVADPVLRPSELAERVVSAIERSTLAPAAEPVALERFENAFAPELA
jgi:hypothetical protein